MLYCIVHIRRCFVGDDYLQNHNDLIKFDSEEKALEYLKNLKACKFGDRGIQNIIPDVPDIRGKIINERGDIYGYKDANDEYHYLALVQMQEERRNEFLKNE